MTNLPVSIECDLRSGEKIIRRLDVSVPSSECRTEQAVMRMSLAVFFVCIAFVLVLIFRFPLHFVNLATLLVIFVVTWRSFDRFLQVAFPDFSELLVTNQRLILRAGAGYSEWVSDYDNEIEVFVLAEISRFAVRPNGSSYSPREVYVKSPTPLQKGKELADLFRSLTGTAQIKVGCLVDDSNSASTLATGRGAESVPGSESDVGVATGVGVDTHVPPGIVVTHSFLSQQLFSLASSIAMPLAVPLRPEIIALLAVPSAETEGEPSHSAISQPDATASSGPQFASADSSVPNTDTPHELGSTGYQFGI